MSGPVAVSRRRFLALTGAAGSGLLLGLELSGATAARITGLDGDAVGEPVAAGFAPNAFLQIDPSGATTIWVARSEMGQGVRTSLPMIVAEELDVSWESVRIEQAEGAADDRYGRQLTGGSLSVRRSWEPLRRAGAAARRMLVQAAADRWGVDPGRCETEAGEVVDRAGDRRIGYGRLVEAASRLPVPDPTTVELRPPGEFRLVGTSVPRVDGPAIVRGTAAFGLDRELPGMRYAAVARCPIQGGAVGDYDPSPALAVPGVRELVEVPGRTGSMPMPAGVAVVADDSWAAVRGAGALEVEWRTDGEAGGSTADLRAILRRRLEEPGEVVRDDGDAKSVLAGAGTVVEAEYELPFLAHAPMEPLNCTVRLGPDGACEVWSPTQNPQAVQRRVAEELGIAPERVRVRVTLLGGGFGRRLYPDAELEAVRIARRIDGPVQVVWTREDDIRHDRFRPASRHRLRAALDADGLPSACHWRIANTYEERYSDWALPSGLFPDYRVDYHHVPWILPRGAWRATSFSQNPFVVQGFLDELARAGGRDRLGLRLRLLERAARRGEPSGGYDVSRLAAVLERVASEAGWDRDPGPGRGRGVAFEYCYGSYIAMVAEVTVRRGRPRVDRVVCAVDCGRVVHPDMVMAQIEGGVAFGLSAVLFEEITVEGGRVQQGNFDDFEILRMPDMPEVEVHLMPAGEPPGGVGETPIPVVVPAVTGAVAAATGEPVRRLPIGRD